MKTQQDSLSLCTNYFPGSLFTFHTGEMTCVALFPSPPSY